MDVIVSKFSLLEAEFLLRRAVTIVRDTSAINYFTKFDDTVSVCVSVYDSDNERSRLVDDLEEGVTGNTLKCADDTKLFRKTKEVGDKHKLQDYIVTLVMWSDKLQLIFNFGKCKSLHTGPGNSGMNYEMGGTIVSKTVKEKDVG